MAAIDELKAMPWHVVGPDGAFVEGHLNKAAAVAACKEMNDYAKEEYWKVFQNA